MQIFKEYTYKWWEMGIFKLALLSFGIAIGAYWHEAFLPYVGMFVALGLVLGVYIALVSFSKK